MIINDDDKMTFKIDKVKNDSSILKKVSKLKYLRDVSAQMKDGRTPMHSAAQKGHVEAIKALKEAGADVVEKKPSSSIVNWIKRRL